MRISHKRKVQLKLQKRIQATVVVADTVSVKEAPKADVKKAAPAAKTVEKKDSAKVEVAKSEVVTPVNLTPKQQQVLDIVKANTDGINPKGIGLEAGQEDSKAASWATGALKKLVEENLVERIQLSGNKVLYKAA
ncbi:MarR family transcriptional regulator [Photobacterium damselae]|uniref:MarR family transcriptional regulator n=1 Tax=Photobacterium damselae TaxID=38293 RepID=UPI00165E2148|nr:MarR family transcriptional regulator [Photobacterium damselae]